MCINSYLYGLLFISSINRHTHGTYVSRVTESVFASLKRLLSHRGGKKKVFPQFLRVLLDERIFFLVSGKEVNGKGKLLLLVNFLALSSPRRTHRQVVCIRSDGMVKTWWFLIKIFTFGFGRGRFASCPICADWSTSQKLTIHCRNGTFCLLRKLNQTFSSYFLLFFLYLISSTFTNKSLRRKTERKRKEDGGKKSFLLTDFLTNDTNPYPFDFNVCGSRTTRQSLRARIWEIISHTWSKKKKQKQKKISARRRQN